MKTIRYAVVGLGHIAQAAVLPAFEHAKRNSRLAAFVSDDPHKMETLGRAYGVENFFSYDEYDACLESGLVDAVYIALPNSLHYDYARRAVERGIHVLCEKPLTTSSRDAEELARAAARADVRLMTAYRLHFERANLEAVQIARSGRLGELRLFNSTFTLQLQPGNIRSKKSLGGGPLYDLGIYCINAARSLFRAEPEEVFAYAPKGHDRRFAEVEEMACCVLRFPEGRLAQFACSFGASPVTWCELVGTKGSLRLDNAYEYIEEMTLEVKLESGKAQRRVFGRRDQFAPELLYFSDRIQAGKDPEPDGREGLIDVRIIEALLKSARTGRPVSLSVRPRRRHASLRQELRRPPVDKPRLVRVHAASRD